MSYSQTSTNSFTLTHAKYLASKVATDLLRFHRLYGGQPSEKMIADYEAELTEMLKANAVSSVVYGFKRNGVWTQAAIRYESTSAGLIAVDDDPGKIRANLDIAGASFTSFMSYSSSWSAMSDVDKKALEGRLPFSRSTGEEPKLEVGRWDNDLRYGAGGKSLSRSTVKGY